MNFSVIGPGNIGEVIIRKLRDVGYSVKMANSRGPASLKDLAAKTGALPVSVEQVVQDVDLLFIVVPQKSIPANDPCGSGGIMLLNHAPLIVAEQCGTFETRNPRRIDLGLGRAPETDMLTSRALRRALETNAPTFADACWNFDIIPKMWKGGRLSAQFQAPACRSHCLFWVRAYSGHRCRQC